MGKACLVDTTKCIGCRACQVACKQWNQLPAEKTKVYGKGGGYENPLDLSATTYTRITFHEIVKENGSRQPELERSVFVKRQCMHCAEPSCVSACPVAALQKVKDKDGNPTGPVVYDGGRCMGCRYCMLACPFGVPTLEWSKPVPYIKKCTFCFDRLSEELPYEKVNGEPLSVESEQRHITAYQMPACAKACPTRAIKFGDRDELILEAWNRIGSHNSRSGQAWKYVNHVYGEKEVGGTSWMYITNVPFEELGFRTDLGETPYPAYTNLALNSIPAAAIGIGAAMGGVYWLHKRRNEVAMAQAQQADQ